MKNLFKVPFFLAIILISILFLNHVPLKAQEQESQGKDDQYSNVTGIRYSNFSGYGPYYERYFLKHYSVKLTGLLYYYEYVKGEDPDVIQDEKNIFYTAGIGIGVSVTIKTRFILELEAGYKLINKITTVGDDPVEFNSANNFNKSQFGIGLGAGFLF